MALDTDTKREELDRTYTATKDFAAIPTAADDSSPKHKKSSKTHPKDKDSFNAKRRCVSTACIACRKRKSKVRSGRHLCSGPCIRQTPISPRWRSQADRGVSTNSAMATPPAALPVPPSTAQNVCTTPTPTIVAKASTRRT